MKPSIELAEQYRSFLEKLVSDEEFRAEFERDPTTILRREGIPFDPETLPKRAKLPPVRVLREQLSQPLEELSQYGPGGGGGPFTHSPFSHGFFLPHGE